MTDPEQFQRDVLYRRAYGLADDLCRAARESEQEARWRDPGRGVLAAVVRQLGDATEVREAVQDAIAGRSPRW